MILFLDFDGVLHPAWAVMGQHGPELAGDGSLFMWADPLAESSHVQIVLSTSWARHLPFEKVRDFLPVPLRRRVVGSTWHRIQTDPDFSRGLPFSYWQDASRYQHVKRWVNVHRLRRWVAIDDDAKGWDEADRARLIVTDGTLGLSAPSVRVRLAAAIGGIATSWAEADAIANLLDVPKVERGVTLDELMQWVEWWQSSYLTAIQLTPAQIAHAKAGRWWPPVSDEQIRGMPPTIAWRRLQ
jgi:hypothetical protein